MPPIAFRGLRKAVITLVAAGAFAAPACERREVGAPSIDPGPVVARINGQPLYRTALDAYLPEDEFALSTIEERRTYFDRWVATQLLYEEAARVGMGVSDEVARKLEQYKKDMIADRLVQEVLDERAVVTRGEVMRYYRNHKDEFNLEVRVSHILTNTIEEAQEAQEMLKTRPFSLVARKMSVDKHTGAGGDLGYLSKGNMLPEFEDVVFRMRRGEVSDIVESEFGYHIIKLTDVRTSLNELPFEQVAPEISRTLLIRKRAAVYDSLVTALVEKARIEVIDPDLKFAIERAESLRTARLAGEQAAREFRKALPEPGEGRASSASSSNGTRATAPPDTAVVAPPEAAPAQEPESTEKADSSGGE
ncbi:MAG TPA: peptidylprolyl isomerase [Candidatus Krumholzibacteria bacterium]|nr:peptidylprolyl isomerase [Candidatus Krumholzibacteria bacterium]